MDTIFYKLTHAKREARGMYNPQSDETVFVLEKTDKIGNTYYSVVKDKTKNKLRYRINNDIAYQIPEEK